MNLASPIIALLVITGKIDATEAEMLQRELQVLPMPKDWFYCIKQIEKVIGHSLK